MQSGERTTFYDEHPFDWASPEGETKIRSVLSSPLVDLIDVLDSNLLIFDVGCGPGRVLKFLTERGLRCIGIDRSRVSVELATSRYGSPALVADNLRLPVSDAIADVVISDGVIHHTDDPHAAFVENLRILKPGGRMYLGVYKPFGRYPLLYRFPGAVIRRGLQRRWSRPCVTIFAQAPYFAVHFIRSRGKRTWAGAINLFYDYFVTPKVVFLGREVVEEWCVRHQARVVRYDENQRQNVHSFLIEKGLCTSSHRDAVRNAVGEMMLEKRKRRMGADDIVRSNRTAEFSRREQDFFQKNSKTVNARPGNYWAFRLLWLAVNGLLVLSILLAVYATVWEFSTRRYLRGFSDAIVPITAPSEEKIEAILNWMAHGPARNPSSPGEVTSNRDPTDTLNYKALLEVCGTATNAFINLLDAENMEVRRVLLLDSHQLTKHVVAEVLVDGRWIIVDPAFRVVQRSADGKALTSKELSDPVTFVEATQRIPHYDPTYTFDHVAHIRMARLPFLGMPLERILERIVPSWDESPIMSLLVERESLAAVVSAILLVTLLILLRTAVRWYGERRLGIHPLRIRGQLHRVWTVLLDAAH
jgi:SAM-dependent methyltransferase